MDVHDLDTYLLVGSGVLILAALAVRLSVFAGMPSLLVYLGLGLALGSSGVGIDFDDVDVAHALGFGALMLILAEGGLTTKWEEMRPVIGHGLLLATLGAAISVGVVSVSAHLLLGLDWTIAVLLAAVLTPTDAAAVFSVLRTVPLKRRVVGVLEAESGLNDAPIVVLVTAISAGDLAHGGFEYFVGLILYELVVGALIGIGIGWLGSWLMHRVALPSSGLYPLVILGFTVLAYSSAAMIHASGFAAVYVAALVLANADLPHRMATRSFVEGVGWLAQIALFVMLGLLADPNEITGWHVWTGVAAGAILTFVARPLTVLACSPWFTSGLKEQAFVAWAGLRGAVPIVLATIPLSAGVEGSRDLFNIVFVTVVVYTLLQAAPLARLAEYCGVLSDRMRDVEVEVAPLERVTADLLQIHVPEGSRLAGVEIGELRLPVGASVSLVVRDGSTFVPHPTTRLHIGDDLLVVAQRKVRQKAEERLRAVAKYGRLAGWGRD